MITLVGIDRPFKPTKEQVQAAAGKTVRDVIGSDLKILFCGINPGLYTAAVGHHFARPGNRFWPALYAGGLTSRVLSPFEESELIPLGYGITNVVNRASAAADELSRDELIAGGRALITKVKKHRPKILAVLGVVAYRTAFAQKSAAIGRQDYFIGGTMTWILPNPSGLNAHYQAGELGRLFTELRLAAQLL